MAVLQYFTSSKNISATARVFGVQRLTVYNIVQRGEVSLKDLSKAPKTVANKTPDQLVKKIIKIHREKGFGPKRISKYLLEHDEMTIPFSTIKGILKRS